MKKDTIMGIWMFICIGITFVIAGSALGGFTTVTYAAPASGNYQIGGGTLDEPVKNLEIDWTAGKVHIAYHDKDTVEFSETAKKAISEDKQMCWRVNGDTLEIRYEKPGFKLFNFSSPEKELTVTLPEGTVLKDAKISATSADVDIPSLEAASVRLDTTSGDIAATLAAETIAVDVTSGDVAMTITEDAADLSVDATSGNIYVEGKNADKVSLDATSGNLDASFGDVSTLRAETTSGKIGAVLGKTKEIRTNSTSGSVNIACDSLETVTVDTTSGDVTLSLPTEPGFTAKLDTSSGDIGFSQALAKQGESYVCGDGSWRVTVDTTSGDIQLK